jgi:hypothetical protein
MELIVCHNGHIKTMIMLHRAQHGINSKSQWAHQNNDNLTPGTAWN